MNQTKDEDAFDPKTFLAKGNGGRILTNYAANKEIYSQGDKTASVFYILSGEVKLTVTSEQGKEAIVAVLGPDDFFGEGCADGEIRRLSSAVALTDCTAMAITKAEFSRVIHDEPVFAEFFISH